MRNAAPFLLVTASCSEVFALLPSRLRAPFTPIHLFLLSARERDSAWMRHMARQVQGVQGAFGPAAAVAEAVRDMHWQ